MKRQLGKSGVEVSALGIGCWAIGGPFYDAHDRSVIGYGQVNDEESLRAIYRALDMGITFIDTSDAYGCGHSERLLGQALKGKRDQVVIATKFGYVPDEEKRVIYGENAAPSYIRAACGASLRRLQTDYIDLYQLHIHDHGIDRAMEVLETLEELVQEGKIRFYGWSTVDPERVRIFAEGEHFMAAQHGLNVLREDPGMVAICEELNLASINRGPLGMGILTGKFTPDTSFNQDDMRHQWDFREGWAAERLRGAEAVREVLKSDGRTVAQGALSWVWARSEVTIPIPGFKTVEQIEENVGALRFGPLSVGQMRQIDEILERTPDK